MKLSFFFLKKNFMQYAPFVLILTKETRVKEEKKRFLNKPAWILCHASFLLGFLCFCQEEDKPRRIKIRADPQGTCEL